MNDLKTQIEQHLQAFRTFELRPAAFLEQFNQHPEATKFSEEKALSKDWKEIQLLQDNVVAPSLMTPCLFFSVQLSGKDYARGKLKQITRQLNRLTADSPDLFAVIQQEGKV